MILLFLLENGSAPIISLPQFSKSFCTSEFMVFEMNSRLSSARRPGAISASTNSCENRAAEKSFFMNYSILFLFKGHSDLRATDPAEKSRFLWQGRVKSTVFQCGNPHASRSA